MMMQNKKIVLGALAGILIAGSFFAYSIAVQSNSNGQQSPFVMQDSNTTVTDDSVIPLEATVVESADAGIGILNEMTQNDAVSVAVAQPAVPKISTMLVAGGCFWCVEADLEKLPGVTAVVSGYSGGSTAAPTYGNYGSGGHREVVEVTYDASKISFEQILIYAIKHMDPTDGGGSFYDRGEKYGPAAYYATEGEKSIINSLIIEIDSKGPYDKPLALGVEAKKTFHPAENYHQDYYKGTLSGAKYKFYRIASGRDAFITKYWGADTGTTLSWRTSEVNNVSTNSSSNMWEKYIKPSKELLKTQLDATTFSVTQEDGTERAGTSALDKNYDAGIYVDVLSGEPLFSSKDKFDSGTGWPSFVKPLTGGAVTEHEDNTFFSKRTEVRSAIADNHLGHVFTDGPSDRGGLRYCLNGVALRFIPKAEMEVKGYGAYLGSV